MGEFDLFPAPTTAAFWAVTNGCVTDRMEEPLPDQHDDGTTVDRWTYPGCSAPTVFYEIVGGGHTWPNMPVEFADVFGRKSLEVDASRVIADFVLAQ